MSTLSLLGSSTYDTERQVWIFQGVLYFDSADEGSNIRLESLANDGPIVTTLRNKRGHLKLPTQLTLIGKILPLCKSKAEEAEDIKLHLSLVEGLARVEALMTSTILGDLTLFGSVTQFGENWDLAVFADLDKPINQSYFKRNTTWKHGLGMGKRLRLAGFHESPPEPTFFRYEYLSNHQVRIIWQVPIPVEGQVVCMRLLVKKAHDKRKKPIWNVPENVDHQKVEPIPTDRLGKKQIDGHVMCVTFAPIALRSDDKYEEEDQYYAFYRNSTHSFVIDNLLTGEYECSMTVQTLQSTLEPSSCPLGTNFAIENQFPPFYIHPPPRSPSNLSVVLQKTKSESGCGEADVYEPFVIVSWKPPVASRKHLEKLKRYKDHQGGPADGFIVSIEVYNLLEDSWQPFGEPTITPISCLKSGLDKESCTLVALPETDNTSKTPLYSKFRVLVSSFSKFGQSEPIYSNNVDIPKFVIDKQTDVVNFCNLEEADCVICMENICFDQRYNDLPSSLYPALLGEDHRLPINGMVCLDENMFTCPVTPTCCSHVFHLKCLLDWCKKSRERQTRELGRERAVPKCPLCMQEFKHVISQVLDPDMQSKRQLFCATAVIKKREIWAPEDIQGRFAF